MDCPTQEKHKINQIIQQIKNYFTVYLNIFWVSFFPIHKLNLTYCIRNKLLQVHKDTG